MTDDWQSDRAEPLAVGPPRQRMTRRERARVERNRRRRRVTPVLALSALVVVVIGAVFLGTKMWHSLFGETGNDYAGAGIADVV
ncbi:aminodeoxychorismate lyase, partial [Mycobacterium sp. ITM-2017-0098]